MFELDLERRRVGKRKPKPKPRKPQTHLSPDQPSPLAHFPRGPVRSAQARGPALSPHPGSPASPLSRSQHAPPLTRGPSLPASSSPRRARATESADLAVIPAALPPYPARRDSRSGLFKPPRGPALPFTAAARSPGSAAHTAPPRRAPTPPAPSWSRRSAAA